jgi:hypothetical protein
MEGSNMINNSDISVIIQGPILNQTLRFSRTGITKLAIDSVRRQLPGATLILSTWAGSKVDDLPVDDVVLSADPGAIDFYRPSARPVNWLNNGNRLISSTQAGLERVNTQYTLKLRSDLWLGADHFKQWMHRFEQFDPSYRVVDARILAFAIYSLKYEIGDNHRQYRPFHVSDWAYFGLSTDLRQLFACPLMQEPQTSRWFEHQPKPEMDIWPERLWRYSPEQYITANFAERNLGLHLDHACDTSGSLLEDSKRFIANNFVILDQSQWRLFSLKLMTLQSLLPDCFYRGLYHHKVWLKDYRQFVDASASARPLLLDKLIRGLLSILPHKTNELPGQQLLRQLLQPELTLMASSVR